MRHHLLAAPDEPLAIADTWKIAGGHILGAGAALLFALPLVRVFINSGVAFNTSDLPSMPLTLAEGAAAAAGSQWPLVAPWIGALGAFLAGSNTISNLTFSLFQFSTAEQIGANPEVTVAAQAVGGAAGNMVTIHNVVAASATVGLLGREGDLIRKTILRRRTTAWPPEASRMCGPMGSGSTAGRYCWPRWWPGSPASPGTGAGSPIRHGRRAPRPPWIVPTGAGWGRGWGTT